VCTTSTDARWVLLALTASLALIAAPAADAATPTGKLVVTVKAPSGVPANATLTAGTRRVLTKAPKSTSKRFTLSVPVGKARISAKTATFKGTVYEPSVKRRSIDVRRGRTARVTVSFNRVAGARRLNAKAVTRTSITLVWQAPKGTKVQLRRTLGEKAPATVKQGKAVPVKGTTAIDKGLKANTTYSYGLFTRRGGRWTGPITIEAGTAAADPSIAAYVAPPSTTLVETGDKDTVTVLGTKVSVKLGSGRATPLVGAGFVLPVSPQLPGGFLGRVESVSTDGRTVVLVPGGLADAFSYYDLDVNLASLPPVPLEAAPQTGARAAASKGLKSCLGGNIDGNVALRPTVQPNGHFRASIDTVWGFIPVGANFDVEAKLTLGIGADVAVKAALSCEVPFKKIVKQITTSPVPVALVFDPLAQVTVSGSLDIKNVGYQATAGFWAKGAIGANTWADGGFIKDASPLPGASTTEWSAELGVKLGGEVTIGPGGGTDAMGAVAGIGGQFYPLSASFGPYFLQGDTRRNVCTRTKVGWEAALNLNAKAWIGNWSVGGSLALDKLKFNGDYGGPWYLPAGCENTPPAAPTDENPSANLMIGKGVEEVTTTKTGGDSQYGDVNGLVPGGNTARVMSTGDVDPGARTDPPWIFSDNLGRPGNPALSALVGNGATYDAAGYKMVVKPTKSTLKIRYVFASEEYPEYIGGGYDDVMAIWVDGVQCANVPNTNERVSVDNVNSGRHAEYFVDNEPLPATGYQTAFDGLVPLTCTVPVTPGKEVTIEMAIADVTDGWLDSAIAIPHRGITAE
jgi:hypothetical protein